MVRKWISETSCPLTYIKLKLLMKRKRNRKKSKKNWLNGCPVIGTHLHILWDTPNRRQSHPRAACRLLGSGTDSVCSHTEYLVENCRSSHEHSAHSCHQPYCVGIYSDLTKTNRHHHHHCWSSHGTEKKDCPCLGREDVQSHRNLSTFHGVYHLNHQGKLIMMMPEESPETLVYFCHNMYITSTSHIPSIVAPRPCTLCQTEIHRPEILSPKPEVTCGTVAIISRVFYFPHIGAFVAFLCLPFITINHTPYILTEDNNKFA